MTRARCSISLRSIVVILAAVCLVGGATAHYTPGTKMPEQRIGSKQDRAALVRFLDGAMRK